MKTYIIRGRATGATVTCAYEAGALRRVDFSEGMTAEQYRYLGQHLPYNEAALDLFKASRANFEVIEVAPDLSFAAFYNAYAYKVGKKVMAENAWKRLSQEDKAAAINYLPRYNSHLRQTGAAKAYPSSYLNNKYWENG